MVTVAAIFQKEPQVLLAHPDAGVKELADLDDKTFFISNDGRQTYWLWLKQVYGFSDDQVKPYTFNPAPFLADQNSVQQGYVTSEPFAIKKEGGFDPVVLMMADYGYDTYSTTIETSQKLVDAEPRSGAALRQRFDRGLVQLSLRRQREGQRADQGRQSGDDRRADRLLDRGDEAVRHRRFRRRVDHGHRRHDRCAVGELLREVGDLGRLSGRSALQDRLHR